MEPFNKTTDDIDIKGFISKDKILEYVSEEDIFQLVFGFKPVELEYVTSPFREDTNPGCWFEVAPTTGALRFKDFANQKVIKGIKMKNIDCFNAVEVAFGLPNFYKTLEFIKAKLIDGKDVEHNIVHIKAKKEVRVKKSRVKILLSTRDFNILDKKFWSDRYGISKNNLMEDKVFPVNKFKLLNTKSGDHLFRVNDIGYAYTEFESGNKKIYRPYKKNAKKFITNCSANDIGGMHTSIKSGRLLIISKSYKDYRVLRNLGLNVRWLQNEGMFPDREDFWFLIKNFDKVVVFFDNDQAGIEAAIKFVDLINFTEIDKASYIHLPIELKKKNITDPSDLIHRKSKQELINFLKSEKILI